MAKTVVIVIVVMLIVAYAAMFYSSNQQTVSLTAWHMGDSYWVEDGLPVGLVVLGAVALGAIVMAICLAGAAREAQNRLRERATLKLNQLVAKVKEQRTRIEELEAKLAAAEKAAAEKTAPPALAEAPEPEVSLDETGPQQEDEDEELI